MNFNDWTSFYIEPIVPCTPLDLHQGMMRDSILKSMGIPATYINGQNGANYSSTIASMEKVKAAMPKPDLMMLNGKFSISVLLCEPTAIYRQNRTHRKSRINKKWRKRYGSTYANGPCPGVCYNVMGTLTMCPCFAAKLPKGEKP